MDNTTITIILLLLVAIGGFLIFGGGQSQPTEDQLTSTSTNATSTAPTSTPANTNATGTQAQASEQNTAVAATVTYSNGQFQPQTVTIQKGQTVRFVSKGGSMWVGADRHPTHTQYDGTTLREHCQGDASSFDQCETGQSYSFTFDRTGSFDYHNHVNPSAGGTVIVQ